MAMGRAPQSQRRRFGRGEVLLPPTPAPAQPLSGCLEALQKTWRQEGSLAALWEDWPTLAGDQLAGHCRPLNLRNGVLTVGPATPSGVRRCSTANCSCWRRFVLLVIR